MTTTWTRRALASVALSAAAITGLGALTAAPASAAPRPSSAVTRRATASNRTSARTTRARTTRARTTSRVTRYRGFNGRCQAWANNVAGGTRYSTAMQSWRAAVGRGLAHRSIAAPAGSFVYWNVAGGRGHIGISVGNGYYRDYRGTHPLNELPNYLGWAPVH